MVNLLRYFRKVIARQPAFIIVLHREIGGSDTTRLFEVGRSCHGAQGEREFTSWKNLAKSCFGRHIHIILSGKGVAALSPGSRLLDLAGSKYGGNQYIIHSNAGTHIGITASRIQEDLDVLNMHGIWVSKICIAPAVPQDPVTYSLGSRLDHPVCSQQYAAWRLSLHRYRIRILAVPVLGLSILLPILIANYSDQDLSFMERRRDALRSDRSRDSLMSLRAGNAIVPHAYMAAKAADLFRLAGPGAKLVEVNAFPYELRHRQMRWNDSTWVIRVAAGSEAGVSDWLKGLGTVPWITAYHITGLQPDESGILLSDIRIRVR